MNRLNTYLGIPLRNMKTFYLHVITGAIKYVIYFTPTNFKICSFSYKNMFWESLSFTKSNFATFWNLIRYIK